MSGRNRSGVYITPSKDEERPSYLGAISDVYIGHLGARRVVLKDLRGLTGVKYGEEKDNLRVNIQRDACKWRNLKHRNIARFRGLSADYGPVLTLVTDFYPRGTAIMYLKENNDTDKGAVLKGIVDGLAYLHSQGVVHCDLRGANVLVDDSGAPRLVDFGLARYTSMSNFTMANVAGPCRWQAPELFSEDDEGSGLPWTTMSDVYSFGMLALEILTEALPFKEYRQDMRVILAVIRGSIPQRPSCDIMPNGSSIRLLNTLWDFLVRCWSQIASERPTVSEIRDYLEEYVSGTELQSV